MTAALPSLRLAARVATLWLGLSAALGCRDLDRFDTGETDAYCGRIIDGDFTRRGFDPGLGMRVTLDIPALQVAPGTLTTSDAETGRCAPQPQFDHAPFQVTPELFSDPLSLLEFGATRDHNFVAWVDSTCQGSALAVVSLMHTGDVEVRLLRRGEGAETPGPGDFGVFQLQRGNCEF
ncbi:MAG TPA: hypothetical protein VFS67_35005 [Polyangiaceae bacterium]|jgi:hypothetical protein|nr:hypothetical protein [Polyangiaceae bacterium]